jgi:DNA mismatch repair protein MutS2
MASRRQDRQGLKERALHTLEFDKLRERLARHASFSLSEEMARELVPSYNNAEVRRLHDETVDAFRLLELRPSLSLTDARDIRRMAQTGALGGQLSGHDLLEVAGTLEAIHSLRSSLLRAADEVPALAAIGAGLGDFRDIESSIRSAINSQGAVVDGASKLLGQLRAQERTVSEQLQKRLKDFVASIEGRRILQEPFITTRDERYVLAVKAEHRGAFQGLIHDISSSGATVFMEPLTTVEQGNAWRELKVAEQHEVDRILRELTGLLGTQAVAVEDSVERLARIDLALAKAKFGGSSSSVMAEVIENGSGTNVQLVDARHPLLSGNVVPISVEIGSKFLAMVISGPNTGGKTVALKTIGLLALMAQAGLPIPASPGSALRVFDGIYPDIGDEQSIEQSLSTFSGHMGTIVEVLEKVGDRSLVLLDELGAGTDPQEGSAVAMAILSELVQRGATSVVTTHHSQLKGYAYSTSGMENASVEFDAETLAPTYRLVVGVPGRSNAMAIAQRLGLPERVLEEARAALGSSLAEVEELLGDIQGQRGRLVEERNDIQQARTELAETRSRLEEEARDHEDERERDTTLERVEVQVMAEELKSRLRHAGRRLHTLVGKKGRNELSEIVTEVDGIRRQLEQAPWAKPERDESFETPLEPGEFVRVDGVEPPLEVVTGPDDRGTVEVQAGAVRMRVPQSRIRGKARETERKREPAVVISMGTSARGQVGDELWVHGMRAQEAVEAVDEYLEKATLSGHHRVRIIHGKGRGILRLAIQRALGDHSLVGMFHDADPQEGGEGVTTVDL